jgi:SIR2-like domain
MRTGLPVLDFDREISNNVAVPMSSSDATIRADTAMPNAKVPKSLVDALTQGRLVPLVGSGMSLDVSYEHFPGWNKLFDKMVAALRDDNKDAAATIIESMSKLDDVFEAANYAEKHLGIAGFRRIIQETYDHHELPEGANTGLPEAIWGLMPKLVITTNYDSILEWTHRKAATCCNSDTAEMADLLTRPTVERPWIWHLHGHVRRGDSLILSPRQYEALYGSDAEPESVDGAALDRFELLLTDRTLLFIGFGMRDAYVMEVIRRVLARFKGQTGEVDQARLWTENSIDVVEYEDHGQPLIDLLDELSGRALGERAANGLGAAEGDDESAETEAEAEKKGKKEGSGRKAAFIAEEMVKAVCKHLNSTSGPFVTLRERLIADLPQEPEDGEGISADFLTQALSEQLDRVLSTIRVWLDETEGIEETGPVRRLIDTVGAAGFEAAWIDELKGKLEGAHLEVPKETDLQLCEVIFTALYEKEATGIRERLIDLGAVSTIETASVEPDARLLEIRRRIVETYFADRIPRGHGEGREAYENRLDAWAEDDLPSVLKTDRKDKKPWFVLFLETADLLKENLEIDGVLWSEVLKLERSDRGHRFVCNRAELQNRLFAMHRRLDELEGNVRRGTAR